MFCAIIFFCILLLSFFSKFSTAFISAISLSFWHISLTVFSSSNLIVDKLEFFKRFMSSSIEFIIFFAVSPDNKVFCVFICSALIFAASKLFFANDSFSSASLNLFSASCMLFNIVSFLFLTISVILGRNNLLYKTVWVLFCTYGFLFFI